MPHGHSAIDNLIALSTLKTYQAGGPVDKDTMLGLFASKVLGKDVPTSLTAGQLPPLSTTGKITPENLSDVWSSLNPPLPEGTEAPGLGFAEAMGPLVSPKNVGAVMKRVTGLMSRYPKSTVQKGMNELFGYLGKTKAFKGQMARTPFSGRMLQHYFTGKGKQLSYRAPRVLRNDAELVIHSNIARRGGGGTASRPGPAGRWSMDKIKKGKTMNLTLPESAAAADVRSALGTSTVRATKVSDDVLRVQHHDTYNFKPNYDPGKNWSFNAEIPEKIANRLPNFRMMPTTGEAMRGYDVGSKSPLVGSARPLLDFNKIGYSKSFDDLAHPGFNIKRPGNPVNVRISGVDAVFPKLGLGKPFTSLSKPYYYNFSKKKFGDTVRSVR